MLVNMLRTRTLIPAVLLLAVTGTTQAQGPPGGLPVGASGCQVIEVPVIITEPGHYCLADDFVVDMPTGGAAILIETDHVVLDFQGHILRNRASQPFVDTNPIGVQAHEQAHIVVRNGTIQNFREGVSLSQPFFGVSTSFNHLIENMRVYDSQRFGIGIGGHNSVVRGNIVENVTGFTEGFCSGIGAAGSGHRVLDNDISRVTLCGKHNNWGISFVAGLDNFAIGNRLIAIGNGILMDGTRTVYRDNIVLQLPGGGVAFSGGVDGGDNLAN